jgi:hypothetical protein
MTLLPTAASESTVRIDLYSKPTHEASAKSIQKWKWMLEQEIISFRKDGNKFMSKPVGFSYECGGK